MQIFGTLYDKEDITCKLYTVQMNSINEMDDSNLNSFPRCRVTSAIVIKGIQD